jgi:hypothetical protein
MQKKPTDAGEVAESIIAPWYTLVPGSTASIPGNLIDRQTNKRASEQADSSLWRGVLQH